MVGTRQVVVGAAIVRDGRVAAVGTRVPIPAGARRVDGRGRYLVPGLADMHTHLYADDGVVRLTLRIPESLKARAEEAAEQAGQSLNTWLVAAVRDATRTDAVRIDVDLSSIPFGEGFPFHRGGRNARRMTGWV